MALVVAGILGAACCVTGGLIVRQVVKTAPTCCESPGVALTYFTLWSAVGMSPDPDRARINATCSTADGKRAYAGLMRMKRPPGTEEDPTLEIGADGPHQKTKDGVIIPFYVWINGAAGWRALSWGRATIRNDDGDWCIRDIQPAEPWDGELFPP